MFIPFCRAAVALASTLTLASIAACSAPAPGGEGSDAVEESATLAGGATYVRLESIGAGEYTFSRVNDGKLDCAVGPKARTCTTEKLVLPADCDWECTDGILSLQGVTVLRGVFTNAYDATLRRRVTSFVAAAGFDTFDATLGDKPVYRLTARPTSCGRKTCAVAVVSTTVNGSSTRSVTRVDFSTSHDPNYVLDDSRGVAQMARPEGLLVSGKLVAGVFKADRVWRQWTPEADCDVLGAAKTYYFASPPSADEVDLVFTTTSEAESYADPQHRSVKWLVRTDKNASAISYTGGINDLWAQTFTIDTHTCNVTLTGEH
jgi:hypothetical protein